jgi:crotonobetainyl-CoA:carnitine CoA-transferase CaiB-like acyl-CoA transferase
MPTIADLPLKGVRVLDASRVLAGPFCGQILGDLGAEVIKLERPGTGDDTRGWGPPFLGPFSAYFLSCNRNKRSLTLDIAQADGNRLFHDLLDRCDVLIENFRSDSAAHLGLTAEALLERHPRLVACSITGFGRSGPLKEVPGYDFAVQAMSGLMSITGLADGPPCKVGVALTDIVTGLYAGVAVLACLRARERSGHGYAIDLALLDCAVRGPGLPDQRPDPGPAGERPFADRPLSTGRQRRRLARPERRQRRPVAALLRRRRDARPGGRPTLPDQRRARSQS